ncbi:MAG: zf-HC2 domain-containing protein [Oscillospiraceae bacterium]|nr:zf-HC2 domain-containing protein [Oscillospiraceae bacterium]
MKISCKIVKDLLPLYHDGVCSNESSAMVEEHLAECDSCKAELQSMDEGIPVNVIKQNLNEAESIQKLSKKWMQNLLRAYIKGAFIALLAIVTIAVIIFIIYLFVTWQISYGYSYS